ncbi:transcriptional regulator [Chryseobacterium shandongense]|uniref:Transcriptional regulator n=2 Tax=Chryseobacterium TaxID=59732 RepID=A0AAD1DNB3_9FLAO|nr:MULTISPECIES: S24 family peptidase [Chryseobacterium]AZA87124.1 transcriptional regulator [Chryseobacterium shandongense]AZA95553.1 transcriptional regulator [Chryseobacterium shandongense]MEC3876167.1 S24 family peptidase [Chryseobacterium sp. T9W2-O]
MQTNLNINSNFFERTLRITAFYGYSGVPELARALGYSSPEKLYRLKKENAKPSIDILQDLSNKFEDLDLNWFVTGEGEMLKSKSKNNVHKDFEDINGDVNEDKPKVKKTSTNTAPAVVTVDSLNRDNIVLVPQRLKAGYLNGYANTAFISKLPTYRMPGLNNGIFRMFEIDGNSMFPTLPDKSFVVGQFVENWERDIKDNQIYAVISNEVEDGLVKRCINKIKKYNNLICKSDNRRNYPTQNINPESIKEIWEIKLHLNFHLPDPADIYDRMSDFEGEIESLKEIIRKAKLL